MGALTSNRKRGDDYYKSLVSLSSPIDQSYGHIAKKPKLSVSTNQITLDNYRPALSNSVVSRISQYPDTKSGFGREVHAPVRNSRFGIFSSAKNTGSGASSKESPADKMGRFSLFSRLLQYANAKDAAMRSLRYLSDGKQKEKEVIEVDSEDENRDDVSDDYSIEEMNILDMNGSKLTGGQRNVENLQEHNVKRVEKEVRSFDSSVVTDVSNAIAKVDVEEKNGLMQLDQVPDDSGVPLFRRLLDSTKKSDSKISRLNFDIESCVKRIRWFHILRPQKKEEKIKKDLADECFMPLTKEEESEVSNALSNFNRRKVLVTHKISNIDITGEKLQCLRPGAWLNDELIGGRDGYSFQSVRRWTTQRKLGYSLTECDKIFVPIHKEVHWCLAIINKKDEKFQYLDSLGGVDKRVLSILAKYFVDEVKDKCGKCIDVSSWEQESIMDLPEQENGFDCGMFMIKYADFYSRDIGLCFSQEHMPYFRRRTAKEILKLRAE